MNSKGWLDLSPELSITSNDCLKPNQKQNCSLEKTSGKHDERLFVSGRLGFDSESSQRNNFNVNKLCGRESKGVVSETIPNAWFGFNPHPGHVVASLDKTFYDDYLYVVQIPLSTKYLPKMKKETFMHCLASDAVLGQEDIY